MKKQFTLIAIAYLICILIVVIVANICINHKDKNLHDMAYNQFDEFFENKSTFVDTYSEDMPIKYHLSLIPEEKPAELITARADSTTEGGRAINSINDEVNKQALSSWQFYGIKNLFRLNSESNGWQLFVAEKYSYCTIQIYRVIPSYIGFTEKYGYCYNGWDFSIKTALNSAYEFFTISKKSQYYENYKKGSRVEVLDLIDRVKNKYYNWKIIRNSDSSINKIGAGGSCASEYFTCILDKSDCNFYMIERQDNIISKDKRIIILIGISVLTLLLLLTLKSINIKKIIRDLSQKIIDN